MSYPVRASPKLGDPTWAACPLPVELHSIVVRLLQYLLDEEVHLHIYGSLPPARASYGRYGELAETETEIYTISHVCHSCLFVYSRIGEGVLSKMYSNTVSCLQDFLGIDPYEKKEVTGFVIRQTLRCTVPCVQAFLDLDPFERGESDRVWRNIT